MIRTKPHESFGFSVYNKNSNSWSNYDDGIISIDIERGNQEYNGPFTFPDPGTVTLVTRNPQLDPYINNLIRYNTKIAIRVDSVRIFTGYIEGINVDYQPHDKPPIITIKAIDLIGLLGKHILSEDFISQQASWTTQELLTSLNTEVPEFTLAINSKDNIAYANAPIELGTTALDAIRERVKTDLGLFSINRIGQAIYFRLEKTSPLHPYNWSPLFIHFSYNQYNYYDYSYQSVNLSDGFTNIVNDLEINGTDNTTVYLNNQGSINAWGKSSATFKALTNDVNALQDIGDKALDELAQPQRELKQITFDGTKIPVVPYGPQWGGWDNPFNFNPNYNVIDIRHKVDDDNIIFRKYLVIGIKYQVTYDSLLITYTLRNINYQGETTTNPVIVRTPATGTQLTSFTYSFTYPDMNEITSINWDVGDGFTGTNPTITVTYPTGGTKTVTLTIGTIYGYNKTVTILYYVGNQLPTSSFTYTKDSDNNYQFTFTGTGATSVLWQFGDGTQSTEFNPQKFYLSSNTVTVTCTATNYVGSTSSSQTFGVFKIAVIPIKYIKLTFNQSTGAWNTNDSYRLDQLQPNPGSAPMRYIASFNLFNTLTNPDTRYEYPNTTYTLINYEEFGGCMVTGPVKDEYGRIQRMNKNDVVTSLLPLNPTVGNPYPYAPHNLGQTKALRITIELDKYYKDIDLATFTYSVGVNMGYADVHVSYDNITWYDWGKASLGELGMSAFQYTNPGITRPNWNLPTVTYPIERGPRFFKVSMQYTSTSGTPDYRINELFTLGPGLKVNNGIYTSLTNTTQENTITDCIGLGGIDIGRNSGALTTLKANSPNYVNAYKRTTTNRNYPLGNVYDNQILSYINYKNMKDWIRWSRTNSSVDIIIDMGQVRYDISGLYLDWRQDNDTFGIPYNQAGSTSMSPNNVLDFYWSEDGVTWNTIATDLSMYDATNNNGAFIIKTTPITQNGTTWSPPITTGSTFVVDRMNTTTNQTLRYIFP